MPRPLYKLVILVTSIQASCAQYLVGATPTVLCVAIFQYKLHALDIQYVPCPLL